MTWAQEFARKLREEEQAKIAKVKAAGFRVWRDTRGIDPAKDFTAEIEMAIKASRYVVACITPDVERPDNFVRREIQYALIVGRLMIVARMEEIPPPVHVVNNAWIEFYSGWGLLSLSLTQFCVDPPITTPISIRLPKQPIRSARMWNSCIRAW